MIVDVTQTALPGALDADVCIIGAGPAGLAIAHTLGELGASVIVLESGFLEPHPAVQQLNLGWARGPIADRHPLYLASSRHRLFGGSQIAWGGWCTQLTELDFAQRAWVPHSGWPLGPDVLQPYLQRASVLSGLHSSTAGTFAEDPCCGGELTDRIYHFAPRRVTLGQRLYAQLSQAPNVRVCLGVHVVGLETDAANARVGSVRARAASGSSLRVRSQHVVLAAGGIENARTLLAAKLGNEHDLVGRFFMEHPHVPVGSALLHGKASWEPYFERFDPALGHGVMAALALPASVQREHALLNATVQLWPQDDIDDLGPDADVHVQLMLRAEQAPNPESRVTLGAETDPLGLPVAQLDWALQPRDWESLCTTAELVCAALQRHTDAQVALSVSKDRRWPDVGANADHYQPWGCHHIGTTRMAASASDGVVDLDSKVHGVENLFVAGSSVFPTEGYANPTLTLIALALRVADHIGGS